MYEKNYIFSVIVGDLVSGRRAAIDGCTLCATSGRWLVGRGVYNVGIIEKSLMHLSHVFLQTEVVYKFAPTHLTLVLRIDTTLVRYVTLHVFQPLVAAAAIIRAYYPLPGSGGVGS